MKTRLPLIFLIFATRCFAQVDTTSIYSISLKYYNAHLDKMKSGATEIFIESNNGTTEKLPGQVGNRQVIILEWRNQKDVYAKHGNKIRHIKIFPAWIKDDLIEITFIPYFGEYKGKRKGYSLGVSDWVIIQFKFDCSEKKFKYWDTKTGGI